MKDKRTKLERKLKKLYYKRNKALIKSKSRRSKIERLQKELEIYPVEVL